MNWIARIGCGVDYIEEHIEEKIDYEKVAQTVYSSTYHFQRVFSLFCGITLGDYIRKRKLTLAGKDLLTKKQKVIDLAFKYGYETPESFSRAFFKFHGVMPSKVKRNTILKSFPRYTASVDFSKGAEMKYKIEEKPEIILVGYKKRFVGSPYGEERAKQEEEFFTTTRAKQWLLIGASCDYSTDYIVITNVDDNGYDFYIAYKLDEWTRNAMFKKEITGVDFIEEMGFETIVIPSKTYAVFETEKKKRPIADYTGIRKRIALEWEESNFVFANSPEIVCMHWRPNGKWENERYIEICLPIECAE